MCMVSELKVVHHCHIIFECLPGYAKVQMEVFSSLQIYRRTKDRDISQGRFGQCSRSGNRYALGINVVYLIVFIFLIGIYIHTSINRIVVQLQRLPALHQVTVRKNRRRSRSFKSSRRAYRAQKGMAMETRSGRGVSRQSSNNEAGHWDRAIQVLIEVLL